MSFLGSPRIASNDVRKHSGAEVTIMSFGTSPGSYLLFIFTSADMCSCEEDLTTAITVSSERHWIPGRGEGNDTFQNCATSAASGV